MPTDDIEEWRPVVHAPEHYEVSNLGRVRRSTGWSTGRVLKHGLAGSGYPVVNLSVRNKPRMAYIHRMVAEAFIGPAPTPDHEVDHIDGLRTNNHLSNLEWVTPSRNRLRAYALGLQPLDHRPKPQQQGSKHFNATLTEDDVRFIRSTEGRALDAGVLAARFGIRRNYVFALRRGVGWTHVS